MKMALEEPNFFNMSSLRMHCFSNELIQLPIYIEAGSGAVVVNTWFGGFGMTGFSPIKKVKFQ